MPKNDLPLDHAKVHTAQKVLDRLVEVIGDGRPPPRLRLLSSRDSRGLVAAYYPTSHQLLLGEQAYDLCLAQGPDFLNALAFLLGHELAHFYRDHGPIQDFGHRFADLEMGKTLRVFNPVQQLKQEAEADYFGGFAGHLAGYNPLANAPSFLAAIYASYALEDNLQGYPALSERQVIAQEAAESLQQLVPIFDAGHGLLLLGQYGAAFRCFAHISLTFPSREILNNAGVARALEALDLFEAQSLRFVYPFELDAQTRLGNGTKAGQSGMMANELRLRLLTEAATWFTKARRKDKIYAAALINQACVASLLDEPDDALHWAKKALKKARQSGEALAQAHALIAQGIAKFHANPRDLAGARSDFEAARAAAPDLAAFNLEALKKRPKTKRPAAPVNFPEYRAEQIDGRKPSQYADLLAEAKQVQIPADGSGLRAMTIYRHRQPDWQGLTIDTGSQTAAMLSTGDRYAGLSAGGIAIGASRAQMVTAYGQPAHQVAGRDRTHHVYPDAKLIFHTDSDQKIIGWMIYYLDW